jgi:hypothetical protein
MRGNAPHSSTPSWAPHDADLAGYLARLSDPPHRLIRPTG